MNFKKNNGLAARNSQPAESHANDCVQSTALIVKPATSRWPWRLAEIWASAASLLFPGIDPRPPHRSYIEAAKRDVAWRADQARLAVLAAELLRPIVDHRDRTFMPFTDSAMLLDDSGGSCITLSDDGEACHYFLKWLHAKRAGHAANSAAAAKRAGDAA